MAKYSVSIRKYFLETQTASKSSGPLSWQMSGRSFSIVFSVIFMLLFSACENKRENVRNDNKVNENVIIKAEEPIEEHHEYVDLGLPSGIKWAMCNLGATSPKDYGNYYTWGSKKHSAGYVSRDSISYNSSIAGNIQYDVATAEWGVEWRIPTKKDFEELFDYCTFKQVRKDGVRGYLVVSKKNDNQIFLPAAGYYFNCRLYNAGYEWHYWSATPFNDLSALCFYSEKDQSFMLFPQGRDVGRNIRPVYVGGK